MKGGGVLEELTSLIIMNRNRMVTCRCGKTMRSDNLIRHNKLHTIQDEQSSEIVAPKPRKLNVMIDELEQDLLQDNKIYLEKIELGRKITIIIEKGVVQEESLTKDRQEALDSIHPSPYFDLGKNKLWNYSKLQQIEVLFGFVGPMEMKESPGFNLISKSAMVLIEW